MKAYGQTGKVVKIKSRSDETLRRLNPRSFDFIYIDGSHETKDVLVDAILAWDLLKPGGLIIFDDYNWYGPRSWLVPNYTPKIAIDAFVKVFDPYIELLHKEYQLVARKKKDEHVDLDAYKSLRSFLIRIQRVLG
jgi:predicted O-methyltransferase YrrM